MTVGWIVRAVRHPTSCLRVRMSPDETGNPHAIPRRLEHRSDRHFYRNAVGGPTPYRSTSATWSALRAQTTTAPPLGRHTSDPGAVRYSLTDVGHGRLAEDSGMISDHDALCEDLRDSALDVWIFARHEQQSVGELHSVRLVATTALTGH